MWSKRRRTGCGSAFRGELVQPVALLFRFPSLCQGRAVDVSACGRPRPELKLNCSINSSAETLCFFSLRAAPLAPGCTLGAQACGGVKQLCETRPLLLTSVFGHETRVVQDDQQHRQTGY